eukprot:c16666_g1_i2.p1 GENE.c16666_g1_i2~~c16666_g1_i2.p1  ORF type:complete len:302 (+),score=54.18 c16666_g1_i2:38-907(+)
MSSPSKTMDEENSDTNDAASSGVIASVDRNGRFAVTAPAANPDNSRSHESRDEAYWRESRIRGRCRCLFSCLFPNRKRASIVEVGEREKVPQYVNDTGFVLPPLSPEDAKNGLKTLILDLDETLVHSSFKPVPNADFIIPVDIEGNIHQVYVCKRPHVDEFLEAVGKKYETIIFTASLQKYADPLVDLLDKSKVVRGRLFREDCVFYDGYFVKDLSVLGRDLKRTIIIDNAPNSYIFQPQNALPCKTWLDDESDNELLQFIPVLLAIEKHDDVTKILPTYVTSVQETAS